MMNFNPEVDCILGPMILKTHLEIYCLEENVLSKEVFNYKFESINKKITTVKLYLEPNGKFDTIYNKQFLKSAGICQSI